MNQIPNIEEVKDFPELEKQYVAMWDKGEFEWNHHEGDKLGKKPISVWRIWTTFIKPTLHHQLQKVREEAVLKGERRRIIEQIRVEERQKARQDWLRDEIVKLEEMKERNVGKENKPFHHRTRYNQVLQTIIDRYHSELDQDPVRDFFTASEEVKRPVYEKALEKAQEEQLNK